MSQAPEVSIVISAYNEAASLRKMNEHLHAALSGIVGSFEILYVNDGSSDGTAEEIRALAREFPAVRGLLFSRNFGHEAAMIAGIDKARGSFLVCMDADLQHPPRCLPAMLEKARAGSDIVLMERLASEGVSLWKRVSAGLFYKTINAVSRFEFVPNASDFFLISRRVAEVLKADFRERNRFLRGFIQLTGFQRTSLTYQADKRVAGESHYSFLGLVRFSLNTLANFTDVPLRLSIYLGLLSGGFSVVLGAYSIVKYLQGNPPSGYTTLVVAMAFFFGILFMLLGAIGFYISKIYAEVKGRPLYIVAEEV